MKLGTVRITVHAVRHSFLSASTLLVLCDGVFYLTPILPNCQRGHGAVTKQNVFFCVDFQGFDLFGRGKLEKLTNLQKNLFNIWLFDEISV